MERIAVEPLPLRVPNHGENQGAQKQQGRRIPRRKIGFAINTKKSDKTLSDLADQRMVDDEGIQPDRNETGSYEEADEGEAETENFVRRDNYHHWAIEKQYRLLQSSLQGRCFFERLVLHSR